ncbi:hypothetical protein ACFLZZ_02670 [Nanoarchaeota archaeon]
MKYGNRTTKTLTILLVVFIVLFVVAAGYIGYNVYLGVKYQQQQTLLQQGVSAGYTQAVSDLIQQAATCQAVPVSYNNATLNLIAVECLQVPQ